MSEQRDRWIAVLAVVARLDGRASRLDLNLAGFRFATMQACVDRGWLSPTGTPIWGFDLTPEGRRALASAEAPAQ